MRRTITCTRCGGHPASVEEFNEDWLLVYERDRHWPFCRQCVEQIKASEGRVLLPDPDVGFVWAPAPRQRQ